MLDYSVDQFEIVRFFSYTSTIPYNSEKLSIDANNYQGFPNLCEKFDCFYQDLRDKACELWKEHTGNEPYYRFNDNKTVFQLRHKFSGKTIFIGKCDMSRSIGSKCILYDGEIYDFSTWQKSTYLNDVICDGRWLWKKYYINEEKL